MNKKYGFKLFVSIAGAVYMFTGLIIQDIPLTIVGAVIYLQGVLSK